ncbi:MAG: hypothetical protein U1F61_23985 [Opitutaceae bacterium]
MHRPHRFIASFRWALAALALTASAFAAELYKVGSLFEPFTTKDQHEQSYTFKPGDATVILVSFEMGSGKKANTWLAKQPPSFLSDNKALLINNIYGMPGVGRMFALPKMKKYPHRILLADEDGFLSRYPAVDNKLTVLRLDAAGVITSIQQIDPGKEMDSVFAKK